MPSPHPFHDPTPQPEPPREPAAEPPFLIRVEHLDVTLGGHFRPAAHVCFAAALRASGLLAALPPEALRDLLLLLTFVTPNGHCAPALPQIAHAMRVSQGKARSRLERLQAVRWQARPLLWHGQSESGLEIFSPLPALCPVRENAVPPSAYVPPPPIQAAGRQAVIAHSRAAYARPRAEVEAQIEEMMGYRKASRPSQPCQGSTPAAQGSAPAGNSEQSLEAERPALTPEVQEARREREEVRELLLRAGLEAEQAQGLLEHYDLVRIRRQLMWLPYRRAKNPAGMLIAAVKDDYEAPLMARKALAPEPPEASVEEPEEPLVEDPALPTLDRGHEVTLPLPDDLE